MLCCHIITKGFNFKPDPPSSNLKRFNSLENIAVSVANEQDSHDKSNDADEEDEQEEEDKSFPKFRITRGRGTNESFRAAVDRSYDVNSSEHSTMDPCMYISIYF
ncbi:hypothetical protein KUTeg_008545 [Tegillarca granosa]|uniref:Uncharacterized protein n=1 Tax=Tegillarca granosa TaxID=220873 RepID=A0ABQ9F9F1_TEGGR|nr:hypothetical protein KUTeg_008545 [Tegillarca granosa]